MYYCLKSRSRLRALYHHVEDVVSRRHRFFVTAVADVGVDHSQSDTADAEVLSVIFSSTCDGAGKDVVHFQTVRLPSKNDNGECT